MPAYEIRDVDTNELVAFLEVADDESVEGKLIQVRRRWYRIIDVLPASHGLPGVTATARHIPVGGAGPSSRATSA